MGNPHCWSNLHWFGLQHTMGIHGYGRFNPILHSIWLSHRLWSPENMWWNHPFIHHGLWVESREGFSKKSAMAHRDISKTIRRDMDDNFIGNNYCKVRSSTLTNKFWGPGLSTCQFIRTKMGQIIEVHVHRINGWLKPFSGWPWGIRSFQASAGLAGCIADVLFGGFFIENHAE